MSTTKLQNAIQAIRAGDKSTGKELLLDILNAEPDNDQAWVWMSAVVDTADMRRDCLEEALKHNPGNKMARRGLEKLQQSTGGSPVLPANSQYSGEDHGESYLPTKAEFMPLAATAATPLSGNAQTTIEYFCKRLIIEKGYQIQLPHETAPLSIVNPDNFLFSIPVTVIPEMLPLQSHFDLILSRQTGPRFDAICIKVCRNRNEPPPVTKTQLIEVGQACLPYSNVVAYGQVMPVIIQVWEIYERAFSPEDEQRLKALKRIAGRKKVAVQVHAIDLHPKRIRYNSARLDLNGNRKYIRRLIAEEASFSEEQMLNELVNSSLEIMPIIAGIVVGTSLGLGLRLMANGLGWQYDLTIDSFIVFVVALIAIYLPKFKLYSQWQGLLAALGYGIVLYGILLFVLDYEPSFWYAISLVVIALLGRFLGATVEP